MWLPYCWQHTRKVFGVRVGDSIHIPGTGLFADRDFEEYEMIVPYGGETLSQKEQIKRYGPPGDATLAPYLLHSTDAACKRYIGSATNGSFGIVSSKHENAEFLPTTHRINSFKNKGELCHKYDVRLSRDNMYIKYWMFATRRIKKGEEIITSYGDSGYAETFATRGKLCEKNNTFCNRTINKK